MGVYDFGVLYLNCMGVSFCCCVDYIGVVWVFKFFDGRRGLVTMSVVAAGDLFMV